MYKIAVMGDRETVLGFKVLGLETVVPDSLEDAADKLSQLASGDYAIVYITEDLYTQLSEQIKKYSFGLKPAIVPIPGPGGSLGVGMAALKTYVEKAVGADIL